MAEWTEKEKDALKESMSKLKTLFEPPKHVDKKDVDFFKDLFNIKDE